MFAKAFIVAATFLVEQASPATAPKATPVVAPAAPALPHPAAPLVDPASIGPATGPAALLTVADGPSAELVAKVQSFYQSTGSSPPSSAEYTNRPVSTPAEGRRIVKPGRCAGTTRAVEPGRASTSDRRDRWMVEYDTKQFARQALSENTAPVAMPSCPAGDRREFTAFIERTSKYPVRPRPQAHPKPSAHTRAVPGRRSANFRPQSIVISGTAM
jgi:hypothetical protein